MKFAVFGSTGPPAPLGLLLVGLSAAACAGGRAATPLELSNRDAFPERWLDSIPAERGHCVPQRLTREDTLILAMERPHPDQLAAVNPRDEWLYLVHDFQPSLLSAEEFARRDTLRVSVSDTRAHVGVVGRDTVERIFVEPGTYRFVLAGRLGTDILQPVYHCRVEYGER